MVRKWIGPCSPTGLLHPPQSVTVIRQTINASVLTQFLFLIDLFSYPSISFLENEVILIEILYFNPHHMNTIYSQLPLLFFCCRQLLKKVKASVESLFKSAAIISLSVTHENVFHPHKQREWAG